MARQERKYHDNFIKYQELIVNHRNYGGLPESRDKNGKIKWVTAGKSDLGQRRKAWWLEKGKELQASGVVLPDHAQLSPICLYTHPTKTKPCQTCGKEMSLEYVYPTKNTINDINKIFQIDEKEEDYRTIFEILETIETKEKGSYSKLAKVFPSIEKSSNIRNAEKYVRTEFVEKFSKKLGPGAMSNCPDRLDGFHSYNKCCRSKEDKGRHASNLNQYGEDRRAYENWADGDWKAASWLMKEFNKHGVSADHIGPISLGFTHRPVFQPMSTAENSSKGNRMSLSDFERLIADEKSGDQVVSWHSKAIWDHLKSHVHNADDVYELCKYMRRNMHQVLSIFAKLSESKLTDLLVSFLNPEFANYSIKFEGFDPSTGKYAKMVKTEGNITQYSRNADRYKRIAFEQLDKYKSKSNRKAEDINDSELELYSSSISKVFNEKGQEAAKASLLSIFDDIATKAEKDFIEGKKLRQSLLDD